MPKVRWVMTYRFCSKLRTPSSSAKFWKSVKVLQSYRPFTGDNFLRQRITAFVSEHSMSPYYETHMHCALYAIGRCSSVTNRSSIKEVE